MSKKAFLTGGSRGIGKGIVLGLAKAGYDVAFSYASRKEYAQAVVKKVKEEYGQKAYCFRLTDGQESLLQDLYTL